MDKTTVSLEWVLDSQTTKKELGRLENYCSNADIVYMTKSFVDKIISGENVTLYLLLMFTATQISLTLESENGT